MITDDDIRVLEYARNDIVGHDVKLACKLDALREKLKEERDTYYPEDLEKATP